VKPPTQTSGARLLLERCFYGLLFACALIDCKPREVIPPATTSAVASAPTQETPSLRELGARQKRYVGVALATWFFDAPAYPALAAREFDSLTAENEMKWYAVEPEPGRFTFEAGDRLVAFAKEHRMRMRGHTLVWHNQLAAWVKSVSGKELHAAMIRHVTATAEHYRGQIAQWDVVNEAIDETGELRKESPFTPLGKQYIADAFRAAHAADPNALLFYNDYDVEDSKTPKSEGAYQLVKWLKESGAPIHGMGFQMHLDPRNWPSSEEMQKTLERFAALGLFIELTEIDVPVGEIPGTPEQKLATQKTLTEGVVRACLAVKNCTGMTFWGLTDRHSWLSTPEWAKLRGTGPHRPLPFDEDYRSKPMYTGILEALAR
jgi:endo-1,4-beta-xylanase